LPEQPSPDIRQRAREKLDEILAEHQPEPLEQAAQAELPAILETAQAEFAA
jgi:trimethylamine:corrinoid methyltransferase-like protein